MVVPFTFRMAGLAVIAGCLITSSGAEVRDAAPGFTLHNSKGAVVTLAQYKGKVVLLDFCATWCTGCKVEIPWYMEFDKKYKRKGLAVVGVSMDDNWKPVKPFLKEKGIKYPVLLGNQDLAKLYNLTAMPLTLLIDRDGKVAVSHAGIVEKDEFEHQIQMLLQAH